MIGRLYHSLPGPTAVRALLMVGIVAVALVLLVVFYEWVGDTFLDSGGTLG